MWMELTTSCSLRKLTMLAAGCGLLIAAGISRAGAVEANCPQWTTPKCTAWNMGPPPSCAGYECVADKQSDPPKATSIGPIAPGGSGGVRFPIVRPPVVTVGGINPVGVGHPIVRPPVVTVGGINSGTGGTTTTIYARRNVTRITKTYNTRPIVHDFAVHQPTVYRASEQAVAMHSFGGGGHGRH